MADLIDASSREAARSALRSLSGEFSAAIAALRDQLVELRALTEAQLDFPEEELDVMHRDDATRRLSRIDASLREILARSRQGSLLRVGVHVVLGVPLSLAWRRSRNLAGPALAHAVNDAVRNAFMLGL